MNDGLDLVLLDDGRYQILIPRLADDERDAPCDRPIETGRKIVENDDALAGRDERVDHVAADVAGAAGDQDRHVCCLLLVVYPIETCAPRVCLSLTSPADFSDTTCFGDLVTGLELLAIKLQPLAFGVAPDLPAYRTKNGISATES